MPHDKFAFVDSVTAPARAGFALAPDDAAPVSNVPKAIYVGTAGDLVVRMVDSDDDVTFRNIPAGSLLAIRPAFIRASGSTAGDIVGLL